MRQNEVNRKEKKKRQAEKEQRKKLTIKEQ